MILLIENCDVNEIKLKHFKQYWSIENQGERFFRFPENLIISDAIEVIKFTVLNIIMSLYLPKYSVRISLLLILVIYYLVDIFVQNISLELTNTLIDILIIAILYFVGTFFRAIGQVWHKKKLKKQIEAIPNYNELSKYVILEKLNKTKRGGVNNVFKSTFSILVFVAIIISLSLFTADTDFVLIFNISLRRALLLIINLYYGFRD